MMKFSILCLITFFSINSYSQICNLYMKSSSIEGQYIYNEDGTVVDAVNLLIWDRCSYGQVFSDGQCLGSPSEFSSWKEALELASNLDTKYLPNIKELSTLVERACSLPSIELNTFPDTPLALYWSSTPDFDPESALMGRIIDFTDGSEVVRDVNRPHYVRFLNIKSSDLEEIE